MSGSKGKERQTAAWLRAPIFLKAFCIIIAHVSTVHACAFDFAVHVQLDHRCNDSSVQSLSLGRGVWGRQRPISLNPLEGLNVTSTALRGLDCSASSQRRVLRQLLFNDNSPPNLGTTHVVSCHADAQSDFGGEGNSAKGGGLTPKKAQSRRRLGSLG